MNIIEQLETEQVDKLTAERPVPEFGPGDTLRVNVKVVAVVVVVCRATRRGGIVNVVGGVGSGSRSS